MTRTRSKNLGNTVAAQTGEPARWFVIGTDTGVGKTVLSMLLMRHFFRLGKTPGYCKPIQSGCKSVGDPDADASFVYRFVPELEGRDPAESTPLCFAAPKAPYFAARDEGAEVDLNRIDACVETLERHCNPLIIEAAGGLLVPVTAALTTRDLIVRTRATPIVVARAGLGTINHTLLTLEALRHHNLSARAVFLLDSAPTPTSVDMLSDNVEAITAGEAVPVGIIPRLGDFAEPPVVCFEVLSRCLSGLLV